MCQEPIVVDWEILKRGDFVGLGRDVTLHLRTFCCPGCALSYLLQVRRMFMTIAGYGPAGNSAVA